MTEPRRVPADPDAGDPFRRLDRAWLHERGERELLRVTLCRIADAVIVTDAEGRVTLVNPIAESLVGCTAERAVGRRLETLVRIVHEESREPIESVVTEIHERGAVGDFSDRSVLIVGDGRDVPVDGSAAPIRDEDGSIVGIVLVVRDVTESRRALEAHLRLAAIVESSEDAIIGKDLEGRIVSWNRGAERLYGYTADEALGRPISMLLPPGHADELPQIISRLRRGERIEQVDAFRLRKDGHQIEVVLAISPDVQEDDVGGKRIGGVERREPVVGHAYVVAPHLHERRERLGRVDVVVDHEDYERHGGRDGGALVRSPPDQAGGPRHAAADPRGILSSRVTRACPRNMVTVMVTVPPVTNRPDPPPTGANGPGEMRGLLVPEGAPGPVLAGFQIPALTRTSSVRSRAST